MNTARVNYLQQHIPIVGKNWLDVGCGGGLLCESLARLGATVTGVDPCQELIAAAKAHAKQSELSINYEAHELHQHHCEDKYDAISCMELLEHVDQPEELLKLCRTLLKPNGILFLSTLNRNWIAFLLGIVTAEYVLGLVPRGTHRYQQFIKPSELQRFLLAAGFVLTDITGMTYDPLANHCELSTNVRINYLVSATIMKPV
jgi:2-polyprenyl-6-hydroxyphenyl methylase/3-demethylubiquinone-9 3-methyltransferase